MVAASLGNAEPKGGTTAELVKRSVPCSSYLTTVAWARNKQSSVIRAELSEPGSNPAYPLASLQLFIVYPLRQRIARNWVNNIRAPFDRA